MTLRRWRVEADDDTRRPGAPDGGGARDAGTRRTVVIGVLAAVVLVVADQVTKVLAEAHLEIGRFVPLLSDAIGFELVYNPGGAFGLPAPSWVFLLVTVLVVVLVATALPGAPSATAATAYGMLLAGALGNVLDRLLRSGPVDAGFGDGYVVDFVAWGSFPRFNVADSAITVGFVLLAAALLVDERRVRRVEAVGDDGGQRPDGDSHGREGPGAAGGAGAEGSRP